MSTNIARLFATLALGLTAMSALAGPDVVVTNTPSNPVPVTLTGTSSVAGSVSVTNTPNVNVVNKATVSDADSPARQPVVLDYQMSADIIGVGPNTTGFGLASLYTVPAGKRLVIEYIDAEFHAPASAHAKASLKLHDVDPAAAGGGFRFHPIGTFTDADGVVCYRNSLGEETVCTTLTRSLRTYVLAGHRIDLMGTVSTSGPSSAFATVAGSVNGYLVDVP